MSDNNKKHASTPGKRFMRLAGMTASITGKVMSNSFKSMVGNAEEKAEARSQMYTEIGKQIANTLGEMKGAVMKVGQIASQYQDIFPALAKSKIQQVSLEARNSKVPIELIGLLEGKDILIGAIDVASDQIETPEEVCAVIEHAMRYAPKDRIFPGTNCGMAPMKREIAFAKLAALSKGAAFARQRYG